MQGRSRRKLLTFLKSNIKRSAYVYAAYMKVTLLDKNPRQLKTELRTEVHDIAELSP